VLPDGFAGLSKRGTYDRLISSDWLLVEELPDEFMRRSVMGEHLFWKLAYREPAQSLNSLVLFDAGPEQLGSPRLLHLAALVVFDARARSARANFQWGILQAVEQDPMSTMNFGEIEVLLGARGSETAKRDHLAAWLQHSDRQGGEVWVIGSRQLRAFLPETVSSLVIEDLPIPGERRLRAECKPAGRHSRAIELELPQQKVCAQLLRDPFSVAVAPRRKLETELSPQSMVFSPSGNKLWVQTRKGELIVFPVPNSPRETAGKPKHYDTLTRFPQIAVGRIGRTTVFVSMDPASLNLRVNCFGRNPPEGLGEGPYEFVDPHRKPFFQYGCLSPCVWQGGGEKKRGLHVIDEEGTLFRLFVDDAGKQRCEIVRSCALALTQAHSGLCYAVHSQVAGGWVQVFGAIHGAPVKAWSSPEAPARAGFGYAPPGDYSSFGRFAFLYRESSWKICGSQSETEVRVPQGFTVHGVIQVENYEETLIVVEEDRKTLSLHGAHGTRRLVKAQAPIVAVSGCQRLPFIAYATEAGEVSVYSLKHDKTAVEFVRGAQ
jgi:hypothetical protein